MKMKVMAHLPSSHSMLIQDEQGRWAFVGGYNGYGQNIRFEERTHVYESAVLKYGFHPMIPPVEVDTPEEAKALCEQLYQEWEESRPRDDLDEDHWDEIED